jgi:hypothetical protein
LEYFEALTHGDLNDDSLCYIGVGPEGMTKGDGRMSIGTAGRKLMPVPAHIRLQDKHLGLKLPGFIGNSMNYLIFNAAGRALIEQNCAGQRIEYLPFDLINHKGRVHSSDYAIINPLAKIDVLNEVASTIARSADDGRILNVSKVVLDPDKLVNAPHLFRLVQKPVIYLMSQQLIDALKAAGVNNLAYKAVPQQARS